MIRLINERMAGKEIAGFYAKLVSEQEDLNEYYRQQTLERKRLGITLRGLTTNDPSLDWYKERVEELSYRLKFLNREDYSSECSVEIGDSFIQIVSARYLQGIRIENPDIADAMRQIFEMVWKTRPEP